MQFHECRVEGDEKDYYCVCGYPLVDIRNHPTWREHIRHHNAVTLGAHIPKEALQVGLRPEGISIIPWASPKPAQKFTYHLFRVFHAYMGFDIVEWPHTPLSHLDRVKAAPDMTTIIWAERQRAIGWIGLQKAKRFLRVDVRSGERVGEWYGEPGDVWAVGGVFTSLRHRGRKLTRRLTDAALECTGVTGSELAWRWPFSSAGWRLATAIAGDEIRIAR